MGYVFLRVAAGENPARHINGVQRRSVLTFRNFATFLRYFQDFATENVYGVCTSLRNSFGILAYTWCERGKREGVQQ